MISFVLLESVEKKQWNKIINKIIDICWKIKTFFFEKKKQIQNKTDWKV